LIPLKGFSGESDSTGWGNRLRQTATVLKGEINLAEHSAYSGNGSKGTAASAVVMIGNNGWSLPDLSLPCPQITYLRPEKIDFNKN
jgi:hypothetical protein